MHFQLIITLTLIQIIKLTIGDFSLVVLHTNDMHARYEECNRKGEPCTEDDLKGNNCYGGFPRVSYIVNEIKREAKIKGQNVIFVNAGDTYLGSNYHSAFIWEVASDMMNQLNYDIMCLGNHEFDDGVENLIPFLQKVNFPVVCCNINTSEEKTLQNEENLYSSYIININGTTDIGVIGYITQKTVTISRPGKVQLLDEISCIKNEVQKLKDKGVNIIMGLGHSGIEKDVEIIQNIPEIDFIVGGHSHTFLHTGDPPLEFAERLSGDYPKLIRRENVSSASDVPVAHAYAFTRYIGKLELLFDDDGNLKDFSGNTLVLDTSVEEDSHVKFVLNKWKDKLKEKEIEYVGNTEVVLEGGNIPCRVEECNMGNLITDAFIDYNMKNGFKDTGIAVYPAGGIRFGINVTAVGGNISTGDLMRVLPFRDRLYQIDIDGQYLKEALEHSVYNLGEKYRRGEFLQYAGIKVVYNVSQPSGERVYSALVKSTYEGEYEELNINSTYTILLPDCLSHGSDGYTMLQKYIAPPIEIANSVYEVVKNYIKENSPITTENSGRIQFVNCSIES